MNLINLTPHDINITEDRGTLTVHPSGTIARVTSNIIPRGHSASGIQLYTTSYGEVYDLPEPQPGIFYIVSALVQSACTSRKDLVIPCYLIRDNGNVVGCGGLSFAV